MLSHLAHKQTITYWGSPTATTSGGTTFDAPIQLAARYEERVETRLRETGEEYVSKAVVSVPQAISIGGYIALGTFANADPNTVSGAVEIQEIAEVSDLRNMSTERRAFL